MRLGSTKKLANEVLALCGKEPSSKWLIFSLEQLPTSFPPQPPAGDPYDLVLAYGHLGYLDKNFPEILWNSVKEEMYAACWFIEDEDTIKVRKKPMRLYNIWAACIMIHNTQTFLLQQCSTFGQP
jgi:hypothetical protein